MSCCLCSGAVSLGYALPEEQIQTMVARIKEENNFDDEQLEAKFQELVPITGRTLPEVWQFAYLGGRAHGEMGPDYRQTLRNEASIEWEDEEMKGLYEEFLRTRPESSR